MTEAKSVIVSLNETNPKLPPNTLPLEHQVAGHFYGRSKTKFGLLQRRSTGDVLKPLLNPPRGPREHEFYRNMFDERLGEQEFLEFLPRFFGVEEFDGMKYLILENILLPFNFPCVIDIKVGRVTYDREATAEKIQRQIEKFRPAAEIGFQLLGWKTYRPKEEKYFYHDKRCARSLTAEELVFALAHFFAAPDYEHRTIVKKILERLRHLEQFMSKQNRYTFIASSLLIVYDGEHRDRFDLRLVDFAHVFPTDHQNEIDENFLFGLRHLIEYFQVLIKDDFSYRNIDKLDHRITQPKGNCSTVLLSEISKSK